MPVNSNLNGIGVLKGLEWFRTLHGQGVLAAESHAIEGILATQPCAPWLWLGVPGALPPDAPYGVMLRRNMNKGAPKSSMRDSQVVDFAESPMNLLAGSVLCDLPLPFANEAFSTIFIQHALDDARDWHILLSECERVLVPNGVLWIAALNRWSPYRLHWLGKRLNVLRASQWQGALSHAGFDLSAVSSQWLGPRYRIQAATERVGPLDIWRATVAMTVHKRTPARVRPTPIRRVVSWSPQIVAKSEQMRQGNDKIAE